MVVNLFEEIERIFTAIKNTGKISEKQKLRIAEIYKNAEIYNFSTLQNFILKKIIEFEIDAEILKTQKQISISA